MRKEGNRTVSRNIDHYNLDVIISVGYRVKSQRGGFVSPEGAAVAAVISDYAHSWSLLQSYDEQVLPEIDVKQQGMLPLELDEALEAIADLKQALIKKKEAT